MKTPFFSIAPLMLSGFTVLFGMSTEFADPPTHGVASPSPHIAAIDLAAGQLNISGGVLLSPLIFDVGVSNNNGLVKLKGSPTTSLGGSINPKTGLLTITFGDGAGKAMTTGTGAVLQNTNVTAGFFLGKTNAGAILLQPNN